MDAFTDKTKLISIRKSVAASENVIPSMIALHALPSFDFVPMMVDIGKSKVLKAVSKVPPRYIGNVDANLEDVMREGKQFEARWCGRNQLSSSENRCTI